MSVTFHRAFDRTADPFRALDTLLSLGVDRVLTSGQAPTAMEGVELLAELVRRGGASIAIIAAGSIRPENVAHVVRQTGVREVHARVTDDPRRPEGLRNALGTRDL
jgi:copper homeostasis protein